MNKYSLSH